MFSVLTAAHRVVKPLAGSLFFSHAVGFEEELLQSPVRVGDGGGVLCQWLDGGGQGERELSYGPVEFRDRQGDVCRGELRIQVGEPALRGISVKVG